MRYIDLLIEDAQERTYYLEHIDEYLQRIAAFFQKRFGLCEIFLFGSYLTPEHFDAESDVDVLVISPQTPPYLYQRSRLLCELNSEIGRDGWGVHPFEIHLITPEEYTGWYAHFLKDNIRRVPLPDPG